MAALTKVSDSDLIEKVKSFIGATGTFHDTNVSMLITDIKFYLVDAGTHEVAVNSNAAVGVICRGVDDMWVSGPGTANLSKYFKERAAQLALSYPKDEEIKHEEEA